MPQSWSRLLLIRLCLIVKVDIFSYGWQHPTLLFESPNVIPNCVFLDQLWGGLHHCDEKSQVCRFPNPLSLCQRMTQTVGLRLKRFKVREPEEQVLASEYKQLRI